MYWGQFVDTKARNEYNCVLSTCGHQILPGEECFGLVVRNRKGAMFTRRTHEDCYVSYVREARIARRESIKERRSQPRLMRDYQLTPEQRRRRQTVMQYISFTKGRYTEACRAQHPERIKKAKKTLLKHLMELQSGDLGPMVKFRFGEELIELLEAGADPTISADEARSANESVGIEYALELLAPDREVHEELVREPEEAVIPSREFKKERQLEEQRRLQAEEDRRWQASQAAPKWWDDPENVKLAAENYRKLQEEDEARRAARESEEDGE